MEEAKVYYTDLRTAPGNTLLDKLGRLLREAGIGNINFKNKFTAIKIHFGEPGNMSFLRPNYAKVVADTVKELGGRPFLTDCNTLYVGGRKDALEHIDSAYTNGFTPFSTGCHVIIADGLKGSSQTLVPVEGGTYVREAKIGEAIMDADIVISLTHFKGHENTGFGGALKNLGMGCGSRAGKMEMHSAGKPHVSTKRCIGCRKCTTVCAHSAITVTDKKARIDHSRCVGCGRCLALCPADAIRAASDESNDVLNCKIAEYTKAVVAHRPHFHVSLVIDVSPYCDCHEENDAAIVPDVGFFASFDPVALDVACADAVNAQPPIYTNTKLTDSHVHEHEGEDYFRVMHPETNWQVCMEHAEMLGIGMRKYQLIRV
ncbi:MAG: DUF362 domain-containing protein [Lachnospiraceae bacterium]